MTPYRRTTLTPDELAAIAAEVEADAAWRREPCPCGARDTTHGWHPCRCGGHRTKHCWGCGREVFRPELSERCADPSFGPPPPGFPTGDGA